MKLIFFIISGILFIWCAGFSALTMWESLSIAMMVYFVLEFIENLGKKLIFLDLTIIVAIFTCLVVPVYFYHYYTSQNVLAFIWKKYMLIPTDEYFSFAVPGIIAMIAGFRLPSRNNGNKSAELQEILVKLKIELKGRAKLGFILITIGLLSGFVYLLVPDSIRQVAYLTKQLVYVGMFYVYFSDYSSKKLVLIFSMIFAIASAIASGMFGELIFILALSLIIILLEIKLSFAIKLSFFIIGIFFILVIQTVKMDYRKKAWKGGDADPMYFAELVVNTVNSPSNIYTKMQMFKTAVRMNQGWLIAKTMYHVPRQKPFANGETIWESIAATIVPRFLWPDKPEAGGKANLKRFWGYNLKGFSMNIGPLGEGYANYGVIGGIIFMFFYGLFFKLMLTWLINKAKYRPTFICWMPYLFLYSIGLETDIMSTMNSLVKGVFFMLVVYWFFKSILNLKLG